MTDNQLIAMIHIAKSVTRYCNTCSSYSIGGHICPKCKAKTEPLSTAQYRCLINQITGLESTKFMDFNQKMKVYDFFKHLGFKPRISPYHAGRKRTIGIILNMAKMYLGPSWDTRLRGFTKSKTGQEELRKCSDKELRAILGWLRRIKNAEV